MKSPILLVTLFDRSTKEEEEQKGQKKRRAEGLQNEEEEKTQGGWSCAMRVTGVWAFFFFSFLFLFFLFFVIVWFRFEFSWPNSSLFSIPLPFSSIFPELFNTCKINKNQIKI